MVFVNVCVYEKNSTFSDFFGKIIANNSLEISYAKVVCFLNINIYQWVIMYKKLSTILSKIR